jgi:hypothetical protein
MKKVFYYESMVGDSDDKKKITVCLLVGDEADKNFNGYVFARGVACCSDKDNFSKRIGRAIAVGRAKKALFSGNCRKVRRPEIQERLPKEFQYKGMVNLRDIEMTPREIDLISFINEKNQELETA